MEIEYQRIGNLWRASVTINGITIGSAQLPTKQEALDDLMAALKEVQERL